MDTRPFLLEEVPIVRALNGALAMFLISPPIFTVECRGAFTTNVVILLFESSQIMERHLKQRPAPRQRVR